MLVKGSLQAYITISNVTYIRVYSITLKVKKTTFKDLDEHISSSYKQVELHVYLIMYSAGFHSDNTLCVTLRNILSELPFNKVSFTIENIIIGPCKRTF